MLRCKFFGIKIIADHDKQNRPEEKEKTVMEQKFLSDCAKEIALFMFNVGMIKNPGFSLLKDDRGITERLAEDHIKDPAVLELKNISDEVYLRVTGMHAFGAGVCFAAKQEDFGHGAEEFTEDEIESVFLDFNRKDAYELALEKLGIPLESGNRKMLDRVIVIGIKEAKLVFGDKASEPQNIPEFIKVLFNAGMNILIQRKD